MNLFQKVDPRTKLLLQFLFLAVLLYIPVFGHITSLPIRIWDESRLAINAYEMYKNGDWIVTHYYGWPDMWNTKPPFLIWLQVLGMKVFGVGELALRLPSAFAAFFTCMALAVFSVRYLKTFWFGFIAAMVLITTHGYVEQHATRTGDYDAMLTLFTTLSGLFFFAFLHTRKVKFLYFFYGALTFGALTKGVTALLFLPAFGIFALLQKQVLLLIKNKHFYFGLLGFLSIVLGYYLLRESQNPGYLQAVADNELGGRYLATLDQHKHGFWFYYNNLIDFNLTAWYVLIPVGVVLGWVSNNPRIRQLAIYFTIMAICFFLVISTAGTKLVWYDVPIYPFLALLIAMAIWMVFDLLSGSPIFSVSLRKNLLPVIFLFIVFLAPYRHIVLKTYKPQEYAWDKDFYEIGYVLKDAVKGKIDLDGFRMLYDGYPAHNKFYINILQDQGVDVKIANWKELKPGEKVITSQAHIKNYVLDNYDEELLGNYGNVFLYKIR